MASFDKYKRSEARFIYNHGCRKSLARDKHVDPSLSYLNYGFIRRDFDYMAERLEALNCSKRSDVNVMSELIVTLPKGFEGDKVAFFSSVYEFAKLSYKEDNLLYAEVHRDEPGASDHIHIGFIPTVYDRKKQRAIVSYDRCVHRKLDSFHPKLSEYLEKSFGYDVGVINGATKDGNKSIEQLKQETKLREDTKRLMEERERAMALSDKMLLAEIRRANAEAERRYEAYKRRCEFYERRYKSLKDLFVDLFGAFVNLVSKLIPDNDVGWYEMKAYIEYVETGFKDIDYDPRVTEKKIEKMRKRDGR